MIRSGGCTATARSSIHDGVCTAGKYWSALSNHPRIILVVLSCLGSIGAGRTCSLQQSGIISMSARQPHCLGLTGGESRVPSPRRYGTYLERRGGMLESVVRCNARVGMSAALVQLDACRLHLGAVLSSWQQHSTARFTSSSGQTRWHGGDEGPGRHTQQRHVPERGARRRCRQHGRRPRARELRALRAYWCWASSGPCAASRVQAGSSQQATAASLSLRGAWRGLVLALPKS
jgi:hypothetical protein